MAKACELLGVALDATRADLRRAWRAFVARAHPDKTGDHETFVRMEAAHRLLRGLLPA